MPKKIKDNNVLLKSPKDVTLRKSRDAGCCSVNFLKCVMHIFNVIFLFAGGAVFAVGAWTVSSRHQYVVLLPTVTYPAIAYLLVAAGALALPVCALGCCSLKTENRTSLLFYTYFLLITFALEAGGGGLAYYYEVAVEPELRRELNNTFLMSYSLDAEVTSAVDRMHAEFKCCGASGHHEWAGSTWRRHEPRLSAPPSCCRTPAPRCSTRDHPSNIYHQGCILHLVHHIRSHLIILAAVGVGVSVIPAFGFLFSCILYVRIKHVID